jgi:hypothetical protein
MDNSRVDQLLDWLRKAVPYHRNDEFSGATVAYCITPTKKRGQSNDG